MKEMGREDLTLQKTSPPRHWRTGGRLRASRTGRKESAGSLAKTLWIQSEVR